MPNDRVPLKERPSPCVSDRTCAPDKEQEDHCNLCEQRRGSAACPFNLPATADGTDETSDADEKVEPCEHKTACRGRMFRCKSREHARKRLTNGRSSSQECKEACRQ